MPSEQLYQPNSMAEARPLHLHTVESVCIDLIGGRSIAAADGRTHSLERETARAVLAWYFKNKQKWSGNVAALDVEAIVEHRSVHPVNEMRATVKTAPAIEELDRKREEFEGKIDDAAKA
jgi:hypothetical protein